MSKYIIFFLLNFFFFRNYKYIAKELRLFDLPDNIRKKHLKPVPLLGGLIIFIDIIFYSLYNLIENQNSNLFFLDHKELIIFFLVSSSFFFLGYFDDKYEIRANYKLVLISLIIIILMYFDNTIIIKKINFSFLNLSFQLLWFDQFFTVLCFLLFVNSFNMLDGINGQAGTYSLFIFIIFIFFKINLLLSMFLIISLLIFLYFNFKGKMFLGDNGTLLLSFIISYFFIKSNNLNEIFYADEIFLIMMIPGFELLRLAILRIINNKHPFLPDNNHLHHILIDKIGYLKSFFIIQTLLVFPYLSYMLFYNSFISLILSLGLYVSLFFIYQKKNHD